MQGTKEEISQGHYCAAPWWNPMQSRKTGLKIMCSVCEWVHESIRGWFRYLWKFSVWQMQILCQGSKSTMLLKVVTCTEIINALTSYFPQMEYTHTHTQIYLCTYLFLIVYIHTSTSVYKYTINIFIQSKYI